MQNKPLILTLGMALSGAAQATLIDRGGGLIYDNDLNITWLADANYAKTSGFDTNGLMNWADANAWAAGLVFGGFSDWRLPTTLQPDASCSSKDGNGFSFGNNCTGSEMGHLFYTEGGVSAGSSILTSTILDDYFINMQSSFYWSGTARDSLNAWGLFTNSGNQVALAKSSGFYAWAVRTGDVAAAPPPGPVPEPATLMLLGLGLACLGLARRRGDSAFSGGLSALSVKIGRRQ